jgi:hypothetical protein
MTVINLPVHPQRDPDDEYEEAKERAFAGLAERDRALVRHDEGIAELSRLVEDLRADVGRLRADVARLLLAAGTEPTSRTRTQRKSCMAEIAEISADDHR